VCNVQPPSTVGVDGSYPGVGARVRNQANTPWRRMRCVRKSRGEKGTPRFPSTTFFDPNVSKQPFLPQPHSSARSGSNSRVVWPISPQLPPGPVTSSCAKVRNHFSLCLVMPAHLAQINSPPPLEMLSLSLSLSLFHARGLVMPAHLVQKSLHSPLEMLSLSHSLSLSLSLWYCLPIWLCESNT
jgi:hypothetical protein